MDVQVLTNTVAPLLGTIICIVMYSSPVLAVREARSCSSLGCLNAIPFGENHVIFSNHKTLVKMNN